MTKQELVDLLFQIGVWWGVKIDPPPKGLICVRFGRDGQFSEDHIAKLNQCHVMADWLIEECEGPWKIKLHRPHSKQRAYLTFARVADAMIFRLMNGP